MINLKNLIDFLPTYFKDTDTYKVDNKGILERFLEISGYYLEDNITPEIENALEYLDINNTPTECLNYLWEFLGQLPFAYGNSIDKEKFNTYYNGLLTKEENHKLSKHWIRPKNGPIILDDAEVRQVLKYSIALLKIRGTKKFFEILFELYHIEGTITDPIVGKNPNLWLKQIPQFDTHLRFDTKATRDNIYDCSQCIDIEVNIISYEGKNPNSLPNFLQFRKAIENIFDRFLPYNSRANIRYAGLIPNDNINISVDYADPDIINLETSKIFRVGIKVTITSSWPDTDKSYQVSGDNVTWGKNKHKQHTIFYATKPGTYYFRSVADTSKIASILINQISEHISYDIQFDTLESELKPGIDYVSNTLRAYKICNGNKVFCKVRLTNTNIVYDTPKRFKITEPGEYRFEIVEFPSKFVIWKVTKVPNVYTVTCDPTEGILVPGTDGKLRACTLVTVKDNYNTPGLTITNMANGEVLKPFIDKEYVDYLDKLGINYLGKGYMYIADKLSVFINGKDTKSFMASPGLNIPYPEEGIQLRGKPEKKNQGLFIAYMPGIYRFKCTQDTSDKPATAVFKVSNNEGEKYHITVSPNSSIISSEGQIVSTLVKCSMFSSLVEAKADFRVRCIETGEIFNAGGSGYIFKTNKVGTYTFEGVSFVSDKAVWVVEKDNSILDLTKLFIKPENPKDPNWVTVWGTNDVSNATYNLKPLSKCSIKLVLWEKGAYLPDGIEILEDTPDGYSSIYYTGTFYTFKPGVHKLYLNSNPSVQATLEVLPYIPTLDIHCDPEVVNMLKGDTATTIVTCSSRISGGNTNIRIKGNPKELTSPYTFNTKEAGTTIFEAVADNNITCKFTVNIAGETGNRLILQPDYHEISGGATTLKTSVSGEGAANPYNIMATSSMDWIKPQVYASRTSVIIKMRISENTTGNPRIGSVEVTDGRDTSSITISQS